jgi:hypothetical protein
MKKFLISEEEKNRILGMHQEATKRHYLGEQTSPSSTTPAKPSYEVNGVAYYVPGLNDTNFNKFVDTQTAVGGGDMIAFAKFMKQIGASWGAGGISPFAYPDETYKQQMDIFTQKLLKTKDPKTAMEGQPILQNINFANDLLMKVNMAYLKNWSSDSKGTAVLTKPSFSKDPNVVQAKKVFSNFDEMYPKVLTAVSNASGVKIS